MNPETKLSLKQKGVWIDGGKLYFSRETERKFYFAATIFMLISGILFKFGLWI